MRRFLKEHPRLAKAYELYRVCRTQQVVTYQKTKGKETVQVLAPFTTGLSVLPDGGGYLDQSNWLMDVFEHFMAGERNAFYLQG